jgi:hypothetical protein
MDLFVTILKSGLLVTHDGNSQLGAFNMDIETFMDQTGGMYQQTYWLPDIPANRYKSSSFQKHLKASKGALE